MIGVRKSRDMLFHETTRSLPEQPPLAHRRNSQTHKSQSPRIPNPKIPKIEIPCCLLNLHANIENPKASSENLSYLLFKCNKPNITNMGEEPPKRVKQMPGNLDLSYRAAGIVLQRCERAWTQWGCINVVVDSMRSGTLFNAVADHIERIAEAKNESCSSEVEGSTAYDKSLGRTQVKMRFWGKDARVVHLHLQGNRRLAVTRVVRMRFPLLLLTRYGR